MAARVVLHVGLMKSGTSYLQRRLQANRDRFAERGLLFPGQQWSDQVDAVLEVLERPRSRRAGAWRELRAQIDAAPGTALVSMEFLGTAPPRQIERVLADFAPTPVEVVITLRDLGRGVPAMWQEGLHNGAVTGWHEYLRSIEDPGEQMHEFWRQQGMGRIAANWIAQVGPERVSLVTVPPAGSAGELLWSRFCSAIDVEAHDAEEVASANVSLDAASAALLRELNVRLGPDGLRRPEYHTVVKFGVAKHELARREGPAIGFTPPPWLVERSERMIARLDASGAHVVGDLGDLRPAPVAGVDPETVTTSDELAAQAAALRERVLERVAERRRVNRRRRRAASS